MKRRELDFANRTRPGHRRAHRGADKSGLRNGHIEHAFGAEALKQSASRAEGAEHHVLTQYESQRVAVHFFG